MLKNINLKFKRLIIKGYTLMELVVVIAIISILGAVTMGSAPELNKYIGFSKDSILLIDTIRDMQVKGGSTYTKNINPLESDMIKGFGLYFDMTSGSQKEFTIFKDFEIGEDLDEFGIKNSNLKYDGETEFMSKISFTNAVITNIYKDEYGSKVNMGKASIVFVRPKVSPVIMSIDYDTAVNTNTTIDDFILTDRLYIELFYSSLPDSYAYRCVIMDPSGQTTMISDKCISVSSPSYDNEA
jgi:prepilin-type N-terminal cleavage/methylation domain-containing protein